MKKCDLHTHSVFSDGSSTPEEIISLAKEEGLSAVALCDHHAVDGLDRFLSEGRRQGVEAVAGVEITVEYNKKELHLLGLFLPENQWEKVTALMEEVHEAKKRCNVEFVNTLNEIGYKIDYERIVSTAPKGKINRVHIGAELVACGYFETIKQAFDKVLATEVGYYKPPERLPFFKTLQFIKEIGAVAVIAHPFRQLTEEEMEELLPKAKEMGLDGIECYYSEYDEETTEKAIKLADKFGLKRSGGSDFHGEKKPDIKLGKGLGNLTVPYSCSEKLKPTK